MRAFEWDRQKERANIAKHGVSFEEAKTVFDDALSRTTVDPREYDEDRFVTLGYTSNERFVVVWHTFRGERVRIIGAREATRRERTEYEFTRR